jgi:ribosomal protein L30/L7E
VNEMLGAIRLRGVIKTIPEIKKTLDLLGLRKKHSFSLYPDNGSVRGMLQKVDSHVAWGEVSEEIRKKFEGIGTVGFKPPRKGFKSIKHKRPLGDLGYRGDEINALIERMM